MYIGGGKERIFLATDFLSNKGVSKNPTIYFFKQVCLLCLLIHREGKVDSTNPSWDSVIIPDHYIKEEPN